MKKVLKNKKAFTLTEMIVVIAIIGILAGVLIPTITGYIKRANQSAAYQEAEAVLNIYETWQTEVEAGLNNDIYFKSYYKEITGEELSDNYYIQFDGPAALHKLDADGNPMYDSNKNPITEKNVNRKVINIVFVEDSKLIVLINVATKEVEYLDKNPVPTETNELYNSVYTRLNQISSN